MAERPEGMIDRFENPTSDSEEDFKAMLYSLIVMTSMAGREAAIPMIERLTGRWSDHEAVQDVAKALASIERLGTFEKWIDEMTY